MTVLYKPVGILASVLGGLLAGVIFKRMWKLVAGEEDSPNATDKQRGWGQILTAAALEGAVFGAVKAGVDRAGATGFERVTGTWPGDEKGGQKAS
jgi:hypothetical protein